MGLVEVNISMSVDGFITGPNPDVSGLGDGGEQLHAWVFEDPDGRRLLDETFAASGAVVTSRKVYELTDGWGEDGLYQMPVVVVTHRAHEPVVKGKTTFTFVTEGIDAAIGAAVAAAGDKKVHVMGGASVIQQALAAGLVDELTLHVAPLLLGSGTRLFVDPPPGALELIAMTRTRHATHLSYRLA